MAITSEIDTRLHWSNSDINQNPVRKNPIRWRNWKRSSQQKPVIVKNYWNSDVSQTSSKEYNPTTWYVNPYENSSQQNINPRYYVSNEDLQQTAKLGLNNREAVKKYQKEVLGMTNADGIWGKHTQLAFNMHNLNNITAPEIQSIPNNFNIPEMQQIQLDNIEPLTVTPQTTKRRFLRRNKI